MKCPLLSIEPYMRAQGKSEERVDCIQEQCNWWDKEMKQCDPTGLSQVLGTVAEQLTQLTAEIMTMRTRSR